MASSNHKLQLMLTALGYDTYGIDGIVGRNTTNAVRNFQSDYGLRVDGIAGQRTMQSLVDAFYQNPIYVTGTVLQVMLNYAGFSPGRIDGIVGRNTVNALINFQNYHGLYASGQTDDDTIIQLKTVFLDL